MHNDLKEAITEVLACLEAGNEIEAMSSLHNVLKRCSSDIITNGELVEKMEPYASTGEYDTDYMSGLFAESFCE